MRSLVRPASRAVSPENATEAGKEREEQRNECTKDKPVGISILCRTTAITHVVACNAEERHFDNPNDEGNEEGEGRDERHEDGADAVVSCTAQAEDCGDAG